MRGIAGISLLAAVSGSALAFAAPAHAQAVKRAGPVSGRVVGAKGAEQARLVPSAQWQKVVLGQDLKQGDVLRTNATGTLALLFADRTQVRLGQNATMVINAVAAGAPSRVTLNSGKAWGRSPSAQTNLQVRTPSATAAIRGTEWAIDADDDNTTLEVFSGEVELANELGSVSVGAGEAAHVRRGQAPVKVTISNPEGREQMLYFIRAEDALAMMESADPRVAEARRLVYAGQWEPAAKLFAEIRRSHEPATRAIGAYGAYVAGVQLGEAQAPLPAEDEPNAFLGRALLAAYAGNLRDALATADAGLAKYPDSRGLYRAKIRIAFLLGQRDTAKRAIDAGLARHPGDPHLLGLRAEFLAGYAGSPKAALKIARGAAETKPDDADLQSTLARIWFELGGLREARRAVERALASRPQDASLLALRADILLAQNEVGSARLALDEALRLEPDLSIVRLGMAEIHNRSGRRAGALDEALAASAGNPSFGRGFVTLAELSYDDRKPKVAIQQLDAADRLDPHGPSVPLARTAIALHRFDADGAISSARDALRRYQGRGGEYSNLSENQQSGSLVSQSFRFLNLEGWGRYYGDRAFDSFSPVSYPDQVLNRTPSPFLIRSVDGTFDSFSGSNADFISSYLQGAVLAPLSVINAKKDLLFSRRNFFEASLGGSYLNESRRNHFDGQASASGIVNGAVPFGYNVRVQAFRHDDTVPQVDVSPFLDQRRNDELDVQGLFGFELTPHDKFVSIVHHARTSGVSEFDNDAAMLPNRGPGRFPVYDLRTRETSAALFWEHDLGYRNAFTLGALYVRQKAPFALDFPVDNIFRARLDTEVEHVLLSANYARSFGAVDVRTGVEFSRFDQTDRSTIETDNLFGFFDASDCPSDPDLCEALGFEDGLFHLINDNQTRYEDVRPYLDLRLGGDGPLTLQGQVSYLRRTIADLDDPTNPDEHSDHFDYQLGMALEPVAGQWMRAGIVSRTATDQDFTFVPIAAVGLRGTIAPATQSARTTSYVARWDAEWLPHFFTAVEYEHQNLDALGYKVPSTEVSISGGRAELDRVGVEANLWLRGNFGARLAYSHTEAHARGFYFASTTASPDDSSGILHQFNPGDRLPYVPRDTGQFALTWAKAAPWRIRAEASVDYLGNQTGADGGPLPGYAVVNLKAEFEPFARAVRVEVGAFNLLDKRFVEGVGVRGPGRTVRAALSFRF